MPKRSTPGGSILKQQLKGKLIEHKRVYQQVRSDMPQIRNWKWGATASLQSDGGCNKHSENDNLKEA